MSRRTGRSNDGDSLAVVVGVGVVIGLVVAANGLLAGVIALAVVAVIGSWIQLTRYSPHRVHRRRVRS